MPIPPAFPPADTMVPKTSKLAIASLVTGICSLFCSFLTGIPAVIMGIIAISRIGKSGGIKVGNGLAVAGIITGIVCGIVGTAALAGLTAPLVVRQKQKADQVMLKMEILGFHAKAESHRATNGSFPSREDAAGMLSQIELRRVEPGGSWLYFPEASDPSEVLLISPEQSSSLGVTLKVSGEISESSDERSIPGAVEIPAISSPR